MAKQTSGGDGRQKGRDDCAAPQTLPQDACAAQIAAGIASQMPLTKSKAELEVEGMSWVDALVICASRAGRQENSNLSEIYWEKGGGLEREYDILETKLVQLVGLWPGYDGITSEAKLAQILEASPGDDEIASTVADLKRSRAKLGGWLDDWQYAPATAVHRDLIKQMTAALVAQLRSANKVAYAQHPGTTPHARMDPDEWEGEWTYSSEFNEVVRQQPKTRLFDVYVVDAPVSAVMSSPDVNPRSGRPWDEDWPAVTWHYVKRCVAEGLPPSKAEARRWIRKIAWDQFSWRISKDETIDNRMIHVFGKDAWDSLAKGSGLIREP